MGSKSPRLIADAPATDDLLGSHSRIAEALDAVVKAGPGGKTIALQGPWGSGKSTIVELLRAKCATGPVHVYTHDVWAHEGDPMRRAFLESLIEDLMHHGWLESEKKWREKSERLALRIRDITRKTTPSLTTFGKAVAISALLVPFGIGLFGGGVRAGDPLQILVGVLLGGMPLVLLVIFMLTNLLLGKKSTDLLAFLLNKTTTEETSSVTESVDPTSIEFQAMFSEMMSDALTVKRGETPRKLVIVVDNLDRISLEEASNTWSLLRSFLDMPQFRSASWIDGLWVLVPLVDVKRASLALEASKGSAPDPVHEVPSTRHEGFLDKVFQVSLSLPSSTLTKWRSCLAAMLCMANIGADDTERGRLVDIYAALRKTWESPTPRELVAFVNHLVVLAVQWKTKFSLDTLCLFILERSGEIFLRHLQTGDLPSKLALSLGHSNLSGDYACLYFNTGDAAEAFDLLQQPIAQQIFEFGLHQKLADEIARASSFGAVVSRMIDREVPSLLDGNGIDRAFGFMDVVLKANFLATDVDKEALRQLQLLKRKVVVFISRVLGDIKRVPLEADHAPSVLRGYLSLCSDNEIQENVLPLLKQTEDDEIIFSAKSPDGVDRAVRQWVEGFVAVISDDRVRRGIESDVVTFDMPLGGSYFAFILAHCAHDGFLALAGKLLPKGGLDGIKEYLVSALSDGVFDDADMEVVNWLEKHHGSTDLSALISSAKSRLHSPEAINFLSLPAYISFLLSRPEDVRGGLLSELASSGCIANQVAISGGLNEGKAACLIAHVLGSGFNSPGRLGQSASGWEVISDILAAPNEYVEVVDCARTIITTLALWRSWIFSADGEPGLQVMTAALAHSLQALEPFLETIPPSNFRVEVDRLAHLMARVQDVRAFCVDYKGKDSNFLQDLVKCSTSKDDIWLLLHVANTFPVLTHEALLVGEEVLKTFSALEWSNALKDENSQALELAEALRRRHGNVWGAGYELKVAIIDVANGFSELDSPAAVAVRILRARSVLDEGFCDALDDDMFEKVVATQGPLPEFLWGAVGPMLSSVVKRQAKRIRSGRRLLLPLLSRHDAEGVSWLAQMVSEGGMSPRLFGDASSVKEFPAAVSAIRELSSSSAEIDALDSLLNAIERVPTNGA